MSPIPWGAILAHGPTVLAAARSLLANQTRQAREQNQIDLDRSRAVCATASVCSFQ